MQRYSRVVFLAWLLAAIFPAGAQAPTRDPHTPGFVEAMELPDGANAPADKDGNFILGPTHSPAPEVAHEEGVPQGTVYEFTMESADSRLYPGIAREPGTVGAPDPHNPARLVAIPPRIPAVSRCMCPNNTCPARRPRSSSGRMVPTGFSLPRWIT